MPETVLDILLVEDETSHVELIRRAFSSRPEKVVFYVARTLKEASALLNAGRFDLVLLDFLLPDGRGIDLLPADKEKAACPFMLMTSHGDEQLAVAALKAGALDYVIKTAENLSNMPFLVHRVLREWNLIQERRKAVDALRYSEEKFRTIADYGTDLGFWLGVDGSLLWVNRSIESMTGYTVEACLDNQNHIYSLIHKEDRAEIRKTFESAVAQRFSGNNVAFRLRHKDHSVRWVSVSWQPIYSSQNDFLGIRGSIRDIHELKIALEKLEEANRELDAFVYTISHDLRTPLTPIIGYAQLLREQYADQLDDNAASFLFIIEQQGKNMLHLLEDLLRLARAGCLERPSETVNSRAVVCEVVESLRNRILNTKVVIKEDSLPYVHLPKTILAQAFENLIINALLYAGEEGGPIEIGADRREGTIGFFVRDHGPGVADSEKSKIFDVFYRGADEDIKGTGVGLAIVRKITRLYGGQAWVEDTPGGGATFFFSLTSPPAETPLG